MKVKLGSIFFAILIISVGVFAYFNQSWFVKQYDKLCGVYYINKGDRAYSHFKLHKAIDYYTRGLRLYPEHYTAWFNLGNIYVVYEDFYSAVDAYEQAIKHNPKMMIARMNHGIVSAEKLGDFDEAINQYNEIIKTKRHLVSIPFIYSNKKSYKLNKGIAYYNMGLAYRQKALYCGDDHKLQRKYLNSAIDAYKESIKILKKDYDARYNLALVYHLIGDYNNAGLTYCDAIKIAPMEYDAHYNLAILLRHLKYYKASLEEMEKATTLITDREGASARQRYVFDVMNDVTRTILSDNELNHIVEKIDDTVQAPITYVHGKLVASDALDKAMVKNFRTCGSRKLFLDED